MITDVVTTAIDGAIATVTINRPNAMNALSRAVRAGLAAAMRRLEADAQVRVVILTGAGDRAFTAGLDLKELGIEGLAAANADTPDDNPVKAIELLTKPCIGAINGVAITGGFEVALACDVLIASDRARFADTHARVGVMPGWGLSQKLSRLIGPYRAREMAFTGNFIDAYTAADWGLVNRVVPAADLMATAQALAADMAGIDPAFTAAYKHLINDGYGLSLGDGMAVEAERSIAANARVSAGAITMARISVQARGRSQ